MLQQSYLHSHGSTHYTPHYSDVPCPKCGGVTTTRDGVLYCASLPCCGWVQTHKPTPQERHLVSYISPKELQRLRIEKEEFEHVHGNRKIPAEFDGEEAEEVKVKKINYPDVRSAEPHDVTKICKWAECGKEWTQVVNGSQRPQDFCSNECRKEKDKWNARQIYKKTHQNVRHYRGVMRDGVEG